MTMYPVHQLGLSRRQPAVGYQLADIGAATGHSDCLLVELLARFAQIHRFLVLSEPTHALLELE